MSRLAVVCVLSGLASGTALGLGVFTFLYARGYSYATNDPAACANCHVMRDHFHAWTRSSHHAVAVCNDCHTPHDLIGKYLTKARNGLHHSLAFTTGDFPDRIRITAYNAAVTEHACRRCHADIVHSIDTRPRTGEELSCTRCHSNVGHLE